MSTNHSRDSRHIKFSKVGNNTGKNDVKKQNDKRKKEIKENKKKASGSL